MLRPTNSSKLKGNVMVKFFLRQCLLCSRKRTYANASNAIRLCQKRTLASTHGRLFQRGLQLESIRP
jgi:hypothetical protein